MKRRTRGLLAVAAASVTVVSGVAFAPAAIAAPADDSTPAAAQRLDNRPGPLTERQNERRKAAQKLILSGQASPGEDGVVQLGADKYYEASVTGTGRLFTILSEFGDQGSRQARHRRPARCTAQIPEPERPVNNSTHWSPDFNTAYYEDLFFGAGESFADFYTKQSSGNYTVDGEVSDWVQVPGNASTYGDNSVEDFGGAWQFIEDTGNAWYDAQVAAGKSDADIKAELASFDVWDRYDADGDGNFDEPDGYLDHFQAVHAGEGEDAGGGAQGEDAIWSHRWYVNSTDYGVTGPADAKFGGAQIGNTGYWIGDYTVEAENGGLGVFAHEYAPRPRAARLLRHRRRREQHRILDAHVERFVAEHGRRRHRHDPELHGSVGEAPARLARLLGRRTRARRMPHSRSARRPCRPRVRTRRSSSTCPTSRSTTPTPRRRRGRRPGGPAAPTT